MANDDMERKLQMMEEEARLEKRLKQIKHRILVMSGKGGVGKSTVAANLARALAADGLRVGLLDVDIHGPSVPLLLGLGMQPVEIVGQEGDRALMQPIEAAPNLTVMSIGFLLKDSDDALIWRGPMKHTMIKQFISDVVWGELDYLIVDCPPGTGDEPMSVAQLLKEGSSVVIVTTPQRLAIVDVRKCVTFCRQMGLPILGVIENMSGFICPHCGERVDLFAAGGGKGLAEGMSVPYLGAIPIEPAIVTAGDEGRSLADFAPDTAAAKAFAGIVAELRTAGEQQG